MEADDVLDHTTMRANMFSKFPLQCTYRWWHKTALLWKRTMLETLIVGSIFFLKAVDAFDSAIEVLGQDRRTWLAFRGP